MPETATEKAAREAKELAAKKQSENIETMAKGMGEVLKRFEVMEGTMGGLQKQFDDLAAAPPGKETSPDDKGKEGFKVPDNLETMDRKDFLKVIMGAIQDSVGKSTGAVDSSLSDLKSNLHAKDVRTEVAGLMAANPDFKDWIPLMKTIADQSPGLSATRYLQLARLDNPKMVTEMAEKYPPESSEKDKEGKAFEKQNFGGLMPGSGVAKGETDMQPEDAAEKAFTDIFGGTGVGEGN